MELMLDPGAFVNSDGPDGHGIPLFLSFLITLSGTVLFTAVIITVLGNILSNRISEFKKGLVRYDFDHHILIIGANSMLVNILKEVAEDKELSKKQVVVLTNSDTEALRDSISVKFPGYTSKLDVMFMYGSREQEEALKYVQVDEADVIYILGEDDEIDHDSKTIKCWKSICKLCSNINRSVPCYLVVDRMSSFHVFQFSNNGENNNIKLTVVNSLENWAQRVLVARDYTEGLKYPSIIGSNSEEYAKDVRFVVFGMTQMAYAMATTVAHIVHKPHFKCGADAKRTKITFIMPDILQEMNFFKGHYENLFKLSHSSYSQYENGEWKTEKYLPDEKYGDFLDVEWEFVDGSIEDGYIRDLLCKYANNKDEKLSIAICNHRTEGNISASLYMPGEIYEKGVPVFVYQPNEGDILKLANLSVRYGNVYPFGMKQECYDPLFTKRLYKAKRIKYLYSQQDCNQIYAGMPANPELDALWDTIQSYVLMYSNIYAANSIPVKQELMGRNPDNPDMCSSFTDEEVECLAEMEHNRWNMEKLLMGFSALTTDQRKELVELSKVDVKKFRLINTELKETRFKHKDITPYCDLPEDSKEYDRAIVRNIMDV